MRAVGDVGSDAKQHLLYYDDKELDSVSKVVGHARGIVDGVRKGAHVHQSDGTYD